MKVPRKNKTHVDYIMDDYPLDAYEFRVMCRILRREGNGGKAYESVPNMAKALKINHHKVREVLTCLTAYGLIKATKRPGQTTQYESIEKFEKWLSPKKVDAKRAEIVSKNRAVPLQDIEDPKNDLPLQETAGVPLQDIEDEVLHISKTKEKDGLQTEPATGGATFETMPPNIAKEKPKRTRVELKDLPYVMRFLEKESEDDSAGHYFSEFAASMKKLEREKAMVGSHAGH